MSHRHTVMHAWAVLGCRVSELEGRLGGMQQTWREGSLIDGVDYGSGRMVLPWPMYPGEALGFLGIMAVCALGSLAAVLCMSFWLIEPSLWRLAPAVGWAGARVPGVDCSLIDPLGEAGRRRRAMDSIRAAERLGWVSPEGDSPCWTGRVSRAVGQSQTALAS